MPPEDLPVAEFAFPGPLRDQLVAAILAGGKITTTGLVADYEHEGDPLPWAGLLAARRVPMTDVGNMQAGGGPHHRRPLRRARWSCRIST